MGRACASPTTAKAGEATGPGDRAAPGGTTTRVSRERRGQAASPLSPERPALELFSPPSLPPSVRSSDSLSDEVSRGSATCPGSARGMLGCRLV